MEIENNDFYWTSMPSSRKADYYLGYYNGSVFIDFDNLNDEQVALVRISFDGYGCCKVKSDEVVPVTKNDSAKFKMMFESDNIDQDEMMKIVSATLLANKKLLWEDALKKYKLI